jgi:pimeloyl-ACP methyl ester carboxylesterase
VPTRESAVCGERSIDLQVGGVTLSGDLMVPPEASGLVIFAHGSGSSRSSPRNRQVAALLQRSGFATLLFDLLTFEEEQLDARTGQLRFDIPLLAERLTGVTDQMVAVPSLGRLPLGYFGASTGAAAAIIAASGRPGVVRAVVSRGGRVDLAGFALRRLRAPILCIVGGRDDEVLGLNRLALARITGEKQLAIVRGATHLFEEAGALAQAAALARDWFLRHLAVVA